MQTEGLISFISATVYPIAILWSRSTRKSFSSSSPVREEETITGSVEFSPKNAYLRCCDNSLSSNLGDFRMDGGVDEVLAPSSLICYLPYLGNDVVASK